MRKITILFVPILLLGLQSVDANAWPLKKTTTIEKAKPLIRNLYYGHSQASQQGLKAEISYIAKNLYPGMYSNPQKCLNEMFNRYGRGYGKAVPNLATVDYDKSWKLPTGLYANALSGKTPKGDIFILEVKWSNSGSPDLIHVVILDGKPYYFLWVCEKPELTTTEKLADATGLKWRWWADSYLEVYDFVISSGSGYRWLTGGNTCKALELGNADVAEAVAQKYLWDYAGQGVAVLFVPALNLVVLDSVSSGAVCSRKIKAKFGGRYTLSP